MTSNSDPISKPTFASNTFLKPPTLTSVVTVPNISVGFQSLSHNLKLNPPKVIKMQHSVAIFTLFLTRCFHSFFVIISLAFRLKRLKQKKKLPWSKLWKNVHDALIEYAEIWQLICFSCYYKDLWHIQVSFIIAYVSYSYELADSNNNLTNYWLFYNRKQIFQGM